MSPNVSLQLEALRKELEDPSLPYPSYYLKPFHAYETGNLEWLAAYEVEPATYAMGIRTFKVRQQGSAVVKGWYMLWGAVAGPPCS